MVGGAPSGEGPEAVQWVSALPGADEDDTVRIVRLVYYLPALLAAAVPFVAPGATKTLQNDGWTSGGEAYFQQGFALGERAAVVFHPDPTDVPATLTHVELLFGGGSPGVMRTLTLFVWEDGGNAPGAKLYEADFQLTSADDAMNALDLGQNAPTVRGPFWVALQFGHAGLPSIARDADGLTFPARNWIYTVDGTWFQSGTLGVTGDWIIRAKIETAGGGGGGMDGGVADGGGSPRDGGSGGRPDGGSMGTADGGASTGLFVTRITPTEGPNDEPVDVAILGRGFTGGVTFRLGPHWLEQVTVDSPTAATAVVPAGLPEGTYDLIAQDGPAQYVFPAAYTVLGAGDTPTAGGCGCTSGTGTGAASLLVAAVLLLSMRPLNRRLRPS